MGIGFCSKRFSLLPALAKVGVGTLFQRLLGGLMMLFLARWLAPEHFAELSLAAVVLTALSQVTASFDAGFVALWRRGGLSQAAIRVAYRNLMLFAAGATIAVGALVAAPLSRVLQGTANAGTLRLAFAISAAYVVFMNLPTYLQANERFGWMAIALTSYALGQTAATVAIHTFVATASPRAYLFGWLAVASMGALAALVISGRPFLPLRLAGSTISRLVRFSRWVVVAALAFGLVQAIDTLIVAHFVSTRDVGLYAAAAKYAALFGILSSSFATVVLPKAAAIRTSADLQEYLRSAREVAGLLVVALLVLLFGAPSLLPAILGKAYTDASGVSQLLLIAWLPMVCLVPLSNLFYTSGRLGWLAAQNLLQLGVQVSGCVALIPAMGVRGAAFAVLGGRVIACAFVSVGLRATLGGRWWQTRATAVAQQV